MSLGSIARELSKLERFAEPKLELEQYPTPGELAAELVWTAYLGRDIDGKRIVDLGAGTGVLGIGALLAGAEHVTFLETDTDAIEILKRNLSAFDPQRYTIVHVDVSDAQGEFDTAIMNPPFGAQKRHADRVFLEAAMRIANVAYTIHNANSTTFVQAFANEQAELEILGTRSLRIPHAFAHHRKPAIEQEVILCRLRVT